MTKQSQSMGHRLSHTGHTHTEHYCTHCTATVHTGPILSTTVLVYTGNNKGTTVLVLWCL